MTLEESREVIPMMETMINQIEKRLMDNDTKLINLALDAGEIMLKNGAETFRVQDTMKRILSTTGREKIEATAISTALIVTLPREEKGPLSMMRGVRTRTINFVAFYCTRFADKRSVCRSKLHDVERIQPLACTTAICG